MSILGKTVLITGSGVRLGRAMALAIAHQGGDVLLHFNRSRQPAEELQAEIQHLGRQAYLVQADLADAESTRELINQISSYKPLYALVNSASLFSPLDLASTTLNSWQQHFMVNLTAPFLLCQAFPSLIDGNQSGRIVNILDWRALRPGKDHLPYTISKAALAALTQSLAVALAPGITVNGLAFGAILPPSDGGATKGILEDVPADRWATLEEVGEALLFLLDGPEYITGEIIHLDGGRHLI
ncbi:MAG TPA: SDR family oxidoreductase [Anaerolineales bacterium]|jgi:NAD(P)-dependent dehydrogenase (short-subunit alcohol dehydrogenase family)|nr:SDR family oxidoreductase [Anaerolineales bacterium]